CAAWTDHVGHREDYERINVGSAQNVIDLAVSLGSKLAHVSTVSVSGSSAETFDESSYYIGQNVSENEYARSKVLAEGLVLDAVRGGLDARIFRVGNLAGRWKDGFFQKDVRKNAFAMRLTAFISLGQYPAQEGISCEMTPVDLCAKALVRLLGSTVESGRIFHLWNNNEFDLVQMAALLEECGYGLEAVPPEKFAQNVVVRAQDDFAQLFGVVRDVAENNQTPVTQPKAHRTLALLAKNDLSWPEIDANYLAPYLSYVLQGNGEKR
ncbi:MAG: NAD-dependent epimerase/dehydratase family protein, partial [Actinobacteria bacterium]|nr:NAD-dependent epimerase/dehydratase family protein [Actinomycetota bacterium]